MEKPSAEAREGFALRPAALSSRMRWTMRERLTIYVYGNIVGACNRTNWPRKRRDKIATAKQGAFAEMDLIQIYQCFCDRTRLRILYLLTQGPLCVCHLQEILSEPQVKISKHLAYLRARRMVCAARSGSWMIYSLPVKPQIELESNLRCLQDCVQTDPVFKRDLEALTNLRAKCNETGGALLKR